MNDVAVLVMLMPAFAAGAVFGAALLAGWALKAHDRPDESLPPQESPESEINGHYHHRGPL